MNQAVQARLQAVAGGRPPMRPNLNLRLMVFTDQAGNFVLVEPRDHRLLGMPEDERRPPTIYLAETDEELESALEAMLHRYCQCTKVTSRHLELIERVNEARGRRNGVPRKSAA